MNTKLYDEFEKTLQDGLVKLCQGAGFLKEGLLESEDLENKWNDYIKDYIADAVANFNDYSEAALAWAGFLGMGVANAWDKNWEKYSSYPYTFYYGKRKWDDMDEHILYEFIGLTPDQGK